MKEIHYEIRKSQRSVEYKGFSLNKKENKKYKKFIRAMFPKLSTRVLLDIKI